MSVTDKMERIVALATELANYQPGDTYGLLVGALRLFCSSKSHERVLLDGVVTVMQSAVRKLDGGNSTPGTHEQSVTS